MGRFYCEYCDKFLLMNKRKSRLDHYHGKFHMQNVRQYYQNVLEQEGKTGKDMTKGRWQISRLTGGSSGRGGFDRRNSNNNNNGNSNNSNGSSRGGSRFGSAPPSGPPPSLIRPPGPPPTLARPAGPPPMLVSSGAFITAPATSSSSSSSAAPQPMTPPPVDGPASGEKKPFINSERMAMLNRR